MSCIYKITCVKNQKYYIGSTVNKTQRWARHRRELRTGVHKNKNMQAAWNKHGEATFEFAVLENVADPVLLMQVEQRYLDACVGSADCFNHNKFADAPWRGKSGAEMPNFGKKASAQALANMSAARSGAKHHNWGKPLPPETIAKIRATHSAFPHNERRHTPEEIAKIAAAGRGRQQSALTRAKRIVSMQGHEVSSTTRAKISQTLSGEGNFWYGKKRGEAFAAQVSRPVNVTDLVGAVTTYPSITALRAATGLLPSTVNRALKSGQPLAKGRFRGWGFAYV
jgi:group I intron endonuclease